MSIEMITEQKEILKISEAFFEEEQRLLADYAQVINLQIKPGDRWAFSLETGEVFYDPSFFSNKGFSPPQAMTATLHELEELCEFRRAPSLFLEEAEREKSLGFHYKILHGCLQDILVNRTLARRAPIHNETNKMLYRQRFFPGNDFTQDPRHLQFVHTILCEAMLPEEEVQIDPLVRQKIEGLKDFRGRNLLELIAQPGVDPALRLEATRRFIEPIFEELFQEDLKERKDQKQEEKKQEQEEKGEGDGQPEQEGDEEKNKEQEDKMDDEKGVKEESDQEESQKEQEEKESEEKNGDEGAEARQEKEEEGEKQKQEEGEEDRKIRIEVELTPEEEEFRQDYEEEVTRLPQAVPVKLHEGLLREFKRQITSGAGPEDLDRRAYELEHEVSWEDIQRYYKEFRIIEPYIEDLRRVFESIINRRIEMKRRLRARAKEGVILDPGLLTQAKLDSQAGIFDSPVWLKYKKKPVEVIAPGGFEVTLVCDLSGSMETPIEKLTQERYCTILFLEALKDFQQLAEEHREEMVELGVQSEVRGFGDFEIELKPLSAELEEKTRIGVFKNLFRAPGAATWDYESLEAILSGIDEEKQGELNSGDLKKAVVVFSDGQSSNASRTQEKLRDLRKMGVTVVGVGITQHAQAIKNTYAPDGKVCDQVSQLPETLVELLKEFTKEL